VSDTIRSVKFSFHTTPFYPERPGYPDMTHSDWGWRVEETTSLERLRSAITRVHWSPIIWREGHKLKENFISADFAAIDVDGTVPLEVAENNLAGEIFILAPTKRHTEESHRYRLIKLFNRTITDPDEYRFNMKRLGDDYGGDPQCLGTDRLFFKSSFIYAFSDEGYDEEVRPGKLEDPYKGGYEGVYKHYKNLGERGVLDDYLQKVLVRGDELDGNRNNTCFKVSCILTYMGLEEDEVYKTILSSPIPLNNPRSMKEAEYAIRRGIKSATGTIRGKKA
jgi:hypothetical protein